METPQMAHGLLTSCCTVSCFGGGKILILFAFAHNNHMTRVTSAALAMDGAGSTSGPSAPSSSCPIVIHVSTGAMHPLLQAADQSHLIWLIRCTANLAFGTHTSLCACPLYREVMHNLNSNHRQPVAPINLTFQASLALSPTNKCLKIGGRPASKSTCPSLFPTRWPRRKRHTAISLQRPLPLVPAQQDRCAHLRGVF